MFLFNTAIAQTQQEKFHLENGVSLSRTYFTDVFCTHKTVEGKTQYGLVQILRIDSTALKQARRDFFESVGLGEKKIKIKDKEKKELKKMIEYVIQHMSSDQRKDFLKDIENIQMQSLGMLELENGVIDKPKEIGEYNKQYGKLYDIREYDKKDIPQYNPYDYKTYDYSYYINYFRRNYDKQIAQAMIQIAQYYPSSLDFAEMVEVVPIEYDSISVRINKAYIAFWVNKDGKKGLYDKEFNLILHPIYDDIYDSTYYRDGHIIVTKDGKTGWIYINDEGLAEKAAKGDNIFKLPIRFDAIVRRAVWYSSDVLYDFYFVKDNGKWGACTGGDSSVVILPAEYDNIAHDDNNGRLLKIYKDGKQGYASLLNFWENKKVVVVPCEYSSGEWNEKDGRLHMKLADNPDYEVVIDKNTGKVIIPASYEIRFVKDFGGASFYFVRSEKNNKDYKFYDINGKRFWGNYDDVVRAGNGVFIVKKNGKLGVANLSGKQIVPPIHDGIMGFSVNDRVILSNTTDHWIAAYVYTLDGRLIVQQKMTRSQWGSGLGRAFIENYLGGYFTNGEIRPGYYK